MIDLSSEWIDIECPRCGYLEEIQLMEVKLENTVYCHNCKAIIKLTDSDASVHNRIASINKSLNDLQKLFKSFGK